MFLGSQIVKLDINFDPGVWQLEDSEIYSIGMIQPARSRSSGLSGLLGLTSLATCGSPEELGRLPELPAAEERRVRRAAQLLQQRLILRQWLATHQLQHVYSRLCSLDVTSLEDVYWLEDSPARHALDPADFGAWTAARQSLPTGSETLQTLKADLWSAVVKNSRHQDAWTWGGMLVVSASLAGLVTLAAMTQPSLAPEAKHSLLQYVTGKYLQPSSCTVEWGWDEPQPVGETLQFTLHCYQRNGHPYPVCDTDHLDVSITHGTNKISCVTEVGSGDPGRANTARVSFTVRVAGAYVISVMIDGAPVCGSPFRKTFVCGEMCAENSRVGRGAAAAAAAAGCDVSVAVRPRDQYDNPAYGVALEDFELTLDGVSHPITCVEDATLGGVTVTLRAPHPAARRAVLTHRGHTLLHGVFDLIVLSPPDWATVQRIISSKRQSSTFEAAILEASENGGKRQRRAIVAMSTRQLVVKEYVLKVIPKRVAAFRLAPSTKLRLGASTTPGGGLFSLDDGLQPPLELTSERRDVIAAVFSLRVLHNCGGENSFKNKQEYFYSELRRHHARHAHDKVAVRVSRDDLVRSSLKATKHFTVADWCRNFDVNFAGEQGVDWGGVRREWFSLLCAELFDPKRGLFTSYADPPGLVFPNPRRPPHFKLKHVELAGLVVGKCLYESALGGSYRQSARAPLAASLRAHLASNRPNYTYFEQDDPQLYLSKVQYLLTTEVDDELELYFSDDVYDDDGRLLYTHDLIPNGRQIRVTNANKVEYLEALASWRLGGAWRAELAAFLRGVASLVPLHLLAVFDEPELELLICGAGCVSVADWRAHAVLSGSGRDWARLLDWFWTALAAFSDEERARLLHFATGSSQLPPGGFQELNPRFQIAASSAFGALPTAHTCFNQLCLPDYDSYERLVRALLWAIDDGHQGFAMI